jgi:putative ABC transport system permease protein
MENLISDIRYAVRVLLSNRGFTAIAVLALALGIGANTAIFSVVDSVLLRPLPYKDSDKLVVVWEHNRPRSNDTNTVSPANFIDWSEQNGAFEEMSAFVDLRMNLTGVSDPEEIPVQFATANLFSVLRANAAIGRTFAPDEGEQGKDRVVVLSHGLWVRRFGGDPGLVNQSIKLNGSDYTVIGVMPPDFQLYVKPKRVSAGKKAELWVPLGFSQQSRIRRGRFLFAVARMKPDVTLAQAQGEMDAIAARFEEQYPDFNTGWGVNLVPVREQFSGEIRRALMVLLGAVGFVLLIACANIANLLLARAAARQKEIAIRTALGAGRWRIIRQLLTESVILAIAGGAVGVLVALWGVELLLGFAPRDLLGVDRGGIDFRVLGFTSLVTILTGLIFGFIPALEASRSQLNETLKEGGRDSRSGARSHRLRNIFVVAEVAMALVLLVGSGLMIRSFIRLQSVNAGFDPKNLLTARLALPGSKYREEHQRVSFFRNLVERIEAMQGVRSAAAISFLPFAGLGAATSIEIVGRPEPPAGERPVADVRVVHPNYFDTMGIRLLDGRSFTQAEANEARRVVIINETMARSYWPDENPLGKQVVINMKDENLPNEIIGIVSDSRHAGLDIPIRAMTYWPHSELTYSAMTVVVRAESNPQALAGAIRQEVLNLDPDQPIADVRTMESILGESVARSRFSAVLLTTFAVLALALAALGVYGVLSYTVAQRTHEIGIRMALGAGQQDVLKLVVAHGMKLVLAGVAIGTLASIGLTRLIAGLLFEVSATDPATFVVIALVLTAVALLACFIPARRATKVDPMVALRYE